MGTLMAEGYECGTVSKNEGVIESIYRDNPDLVIIDMNGSTETFKLLEEMKSAPSTKDIPVILISHQTSETNVIKAYEMGVFDYVCDQCLKEAALVKIRRSLRLWSKNKELQEMAAKDYLTSLYNRRFFMERLGEEISRSQRYKTPLSLLLMDIDDFKKVNDRYGHDCGDAVLKQFAARLRSVFRQEDNVARYGGEEFAALLPGIPLKGAEIAAERALAAIREVPFICSVNDGEVTLTVTASIGVSSFGGEHHCFKDELINSLLVRSDKALYDAKDKGRDLVIVCGD